MRSHVIVALALAASSSFLLAGGCSSSDSSSGGSSSGTPGSSGGTTTPTGGDASADGATSSGGGTDTAEACTCPGVPSGTETFQCDSPDICGGKLPCVGAKGKGACRVECCNDWTSCEANLGKQATCGANEICSCTNGIQCGSDGRCTCTGGVGTLGFCFPK